MSFSRGLWGTDSNSWPVRVATYLPNLWSHDFLLFFSFFFFSCGEFNWHVVKNILEKKE
jgi:hypothetical protein